MNRLFIFKIDRVISFLRLGSKHFLPDFSVIYDQSDLARLEISLNGEHNALRSQENVAGVTMPLSV